MMMGRRQSLRLGLTSWLLLMAFALLPVGAAYAQGLGGGGMPSGPAKPTTREQFQDRVVMEGGPNFGPVGPTPLIVDIHIVGNSTVREADIYAQLRTRKDRYYDPETVQADVHRLINHAKLQDVKVYTREVSGGIVVTFEVFELPTIRYLKFHGNRGYSDKKLAQQTGLKLGDPLNRFSVEEGRRKIEEFYQSKGYSNAQIGIIEGDKPQHLGVVYQICEGTLERHASTKFIGNTFVSDERLKTLIKSKPGILYMIKGVVDRSQIDEDVDRLTSYYRSFGYFSARISRELEFDESGKWLTLTFVIDEGPRYTVRSVSVEGNEKYTSESLLGQLQLVAGQPFDLGKMNRDVNSLRDAYGSQGYIFADIAADPRFLETPGELDLVYSIKEGDLFRVGKINVNIAGENPHTRRNVVLNRLSLYPGDIIDLREVRASERRLKSSQLFENNPATGQIPKIVIRPPELSEIENLASPPRSTVRGQSPDTGRN